MRYILFRNIVCRAVYLSPKFLVAYPCCWLQQMGGHISDRIFTIALTCSSAKLEVGIVLVKCSVRQDGAVCTPCVHNRYVSWILRKGSEQKKKNSFDCVFQITKKIEKFPERQRVNSSLNRSTTGRATRHISEGAPEGRSKSIMYLGIFYM
jgi:hypothetical protein